MKKKISILFVVITLILGIILVTLIIKRYLVIIPFTLLLFTPALSSIIRRGWIGNINTHKVASNLFVGGLLAAVLSIMNLTTINSYIDSLIWKGRLSKTVEAEDDDGNFSGDFNADVDQVYYAEYYEFNSNDGHSVIIEAIQWLSAILIISIPIFDFFILRSFLKEVEE